MDTESVKNFTKARVLYLLDKLADTNADSLKNVWVSVPDMVALTGVNEGSLRVLLKRWPDWHYVNEWQAPASIMSDHRRHKLYEIGYRGAAWVASMGKWYGRAHEAESIVDKLLSEGNSRIVELRGISWLPPGAEMGGAIEWPFLTKDDVHPMMGIGNSILVGSVGEACLVAARLYKVKLSEACIRAAEALDDWLKTNVMVEPGR